MQAFRGSLRVEGLSLAKGAFPSCPFCCLWLNSFGAAMMDNIPFIAAMIPIVDHMEQVLGYLCSRFGGH